MFENKKKCIIDKIVYLIFNLKNETFLYDFLGHFRFLLYKY